MVLPASLHLLFPQSWGHSLEKPRRLVCEAHASMFRVLASWVLALLWDRASVTRQYSIFWCINGNQGSTHSSPSLPAQVYRLPRLAPGSHHNCRCWNRHLDCAVALQSPVWIVFGCGNLVQRCVRELDQTAAEDFPLDRMLLNCRRR